MGEIPLYAFIYIAIYAQVFLTIVLFEEWENIFEDNTDKELKNFPKVVIAVPCWNESKTVEKTFISLLALDYPKDKLEIWAVDDGSTDNTWEVLQRYQNNPQIKVFTKENGGKHTAVNFVIENSSSEIFGCLDADSYVKTDTLKNMVMKFEDDKEVMAVTPLMVVRNPENLLQSMQTVEYNLGLILKKVFSSIGAIHVTPGPFSLFRTEVFTKIGLYKKAHHTEDMEFAFRMQKNHLKIASAVNAYVETSTPDTLKKLYKQRLRWTQGFMQNSLDYKDMIFRPKYGNVALFTIPLGWIGIFMVLYSAFYSVFFLFKYLMAQFNYFRVFGYDFSFSILSVNDYVEKLFFSTNTISLLAIPLIISGLTFIIMGHRLSLEGSKSVRYIFYFMFLWALIVPFWIAKALYNTITNRSISWR